MTRPESAGGEQEFWPAGADDRTAPMGESIGRGGARGRYDSTTGLVTAISDELAAAGESLAPEGEVLQS